MTGIEQPAYLGVERSIGGKRWRLRAGDDRVALQMAHVPRARAVAAAAVEQRDGVAPAQGGLCQMAADELAAAEHENVHLGGPRHDRQLDPRGMTAPAMEGPPGRSTGRDGREGVGVRPRER